MLDLIASAIILIGFVWLIIMAKQIGKKDKRIRELFNEIINHAAQPAKAEGGKMKSKIKAGSDIPIKPEHVKLLKDLIDREANIKFALGTLSEMLRERHEVFWNTVSKLYPELEDWITTADVKENCFHVLYEKTSAWSKRHTKETAGVN